MNPEKVLKAAVVGGGFMGRVHAEALARIGIRLGGILASTPEKSIEFAAAWNADRAYADFDELLTDDEVDSVHLCVPNRHHFPMAKAAMLAGKHVLCEKPLAMSSAESEELVEIANAHPELVAAVNYNVRYYPHCLESRSRITIESLGRLLHITGSYTQDWLLKPTDFNWRVSSGEGGPLRAIADIGTHWLDLVQFITGLRMVEVCADLQVVHAKRTYSSLEKDTFAARNPTVRGVQSVQVDTEDAGSVLIHFENGVHGVLNVSQTSAGRKNRLIFEISGEQESLAWNSERCEELWIGRRDEPNGILVRDPSLLSGAASSASGYPGGHAVGYPDTFAALFRSFYEAVETGNRSDALPTFEDGHREMLICDAILNSHQTRSWVALNTP